MRKTRNESYEIITSTALKLFKEKGYDKVSVSDICNGANVQRCTFYNLFSNKENIIFSIFFDNNFNEKELVYDMISSPNDLERLRRVLLI